MSSHAPGAIQVEKVLDDLIHRLLNGESGPEARAALIEARRLRNVAMRWTAIPPQPDARREMLARVMELIDTVNQSAERASGERAVGRVSAGAFTSVPPPSASRPTTASRQPAPRSQPPRSVPPAAPSHPPRAAPATAAPRAASSPPLAPIEPPHAASRRVHIRDEPTLDEEPLEPLDVADAVPDLGAPKVPTFEPALSASKPPSAPPVAAAPKPLTLRPPSAPREPFERSLSSAPTTAKRIPIAVPSARGDGLEGLSTTISSSQRRAVHEGSPPSVPPRAPAAPPSRRPPPLPKRSASSASTAAQPPPSAPPAPRRTVEGLGTAAPITSTQRPPAGTSAPPGGAVTVNVVEGLVLVRAGAAEWQPHPLWAGTSMKLLYHNPESGGEYTALVRLSAGAVLPHRRHIKAEEMWMISGSASVGDHEIRAGEYTRAEGGSHHPRISSKQGCTFLLKGFDDDEILDSNPPAADPAGGAA